MVVQNPPLGTARLNIYNINITPRDRVLGSDDGIVRHHDAVVRKDVPLQDENSVIHTALAADSSVARIRGK
eukprot:10967952-Heterocapsa_arctica.AAC.1